MHFNLFIIVVVIIIMVTTVFSLRQDLFITVAHCCLGWLPSELPGSSCFCFQCHLQGHAAIPSLSVGAWNTGSDPHFLRASTLVMTESSP